MHNYLCVHEIVHFITAKKNQCKNETWGGMIWHLNTLCLGPHSACVSKTKCRITKDNLNMKYNFIWKLNVRKLLSSDFLRCGIIGNLMKWLNPSNSNSAELLSQRQKKRLWTEQWTKKVGLFRNFLSGGRKKFWPCETVLTSKTLSLD